MHRIHSPFAIPSPPSPHCYQPLDHRTTNHSDGYQVHDIAHLARHLTMTYRHNAPKRAAAQQYTHQKHRTAGTFSTSTMGSETPALLLEISDPSWNTKHLLHCYAHTESGHTLSNPIPPSTDVYTDLSPIQPTSRSVRSAASTATGSATGSNIGETSVSTNTACFSIDIH